ncbi:nucleotidyltransferase domain-containing protein [Nocardia takedensis]|uniref:nucleotidyltransferase domain-containing protein n=1 Tax=Nocardia takedensis TaxID=259390 RepID=UPI003F77807E
MTTILSVLAYGSRARGDLNEGSDVDIIAIADCGPPSAITWNRAKGLRYPRDQAVLAAQQGDLFAYHLVSEGAVVFECEPVFAELQSTFQFKDDYTEDIRKASDVGWLLLHHLERALDTVSFNRRMAWCTYTMIVARAANARTPVFSAAGLADFAEHEGVGTVLRNKRKRAMNLDTIEEFRYILEKFGAPEPKPLATLSEEWRRFRTDRNPAGIVAIKALRRRVVDPISGGGSYGAS